MVKVRVGLQEMLVSVMSSEVMETQFCICVCVCVRVGSSHYNTTDPEFPVTSSVCCGSVCCM